MLIFVFWFSGIFPSKRGVRGVTPSYEVRGVTPTDAIFILYIVKAKFSLTLAFLFLAAIQTLII